MSSRRGGIIQFKVDGIQYDAKGNFSHNFGVPKRESMMGADRRHGFKETPQPAYIEGEITDANDLDIRKVMSLRNVTVTLLVANGKTRVLRNADYCGADGTVGSEEGNIQVRFEGDEMDEVR